LFRRLFSGINFLSGRTDPEKLPSPERDEQALASTLEPEFFLMGRAPAGTRHSRPWAGKLGNNHTLAQNRHVQTPG